MARTIDQIVQGMLGAHLIEIARLTARVEELEEQLKQAQPPGTKNGN